MEKELRIPGGTSLEEAVNKLLEEKAKGEHVFCIFNGHEFHSDTVTMDKAYLEVHGKTKEEFDKEMDESIEKWKREKEARELVEKAYEDKVAADRALTGERPITEELVVSGLKFIAENQSLSQEELIDGLLDLGCNFSLEDVRKQFPEATQIIVNKGMKEGEISSGASVLANMRDSEYGRDYGSDAFLSTDSNSSIYHFVRKVTGDESYTMDSIERKRHK